MLNPQHPAFEQAICSEEQPVVWDLRLFERRS
jgi:hypothetical protein